MAKKILKIDVGIECEQDISNEWQAQVSAVLVVTVSEHPEFKIRKNISVTLTPQQENSILNFVRNVVVPQAEVNK